AGHCGKVFGKSRCDGMDVQYSPKREIQRWQRIERKRCGGNPHRDLGCQESESQGTHGQLELHANLFWSLLERPAYDVHTVETLWALQSNALMFSPQRIET